MKKFLTLFLSIFLLSGCFFTNSHTKKKQELISQSVYATNDGIKSKRYDLAKKYSDESIKLVPPPKNKIPIESIAFKKIDPKTKAVTIENAVILPEESVGSTIRLNSKEYFELLKQKEVARAFQEGEKGWIEYSTTVERFRMDDAARISALESKLANKDNIGILDVIKYGVMALLSIPILIVLIVAAWLIGIIVRIVRRGLVKN